MAYLRDRLAIEVQAAAQKQAAAEQAAYEKTARAAEAASRRKQAAALQAQAAEAANAVHAAAPAVRQIDTSRAVRAASLVLNQSAKQASASAQQVEKSWNGAMNSITRSARKAGSGVQRFGARLGSIVSGALVFNLISTGLSRLVGWFGTAMSSSNSFRQALANLQGAASTAAAPLVQALGSALSYVINLLATGISYLARFISLLTGKSISSMKAGAQAMNNYGSAAAGAAAAAEKANRSLAGFDEITRLDAPQQQTSGGGGGSAGPDYDFVDNTAAGFDRLMDKARAFWAGFRKLYEPSLDAWGKAWNQVKATALAVWPEVKTAASDLMNNGCAAISVLHDPNLGPWHCQLLESGHGPHHRRSGVQRHHQFCHSLYQWVPDGNRRHQSHFAARYAADRYHLERPDVGHLRLLVPSTASRYWMA